MAQTKCAQAAPPYYGVVLQKGSQGPDVALVQSWLTYINLNTGVGTIDGMFGSNTESAVKIFQSSANLTVDGKVGSATWNALYGVFADQYGQGEIYPGIAVRQGNSGAVVKSMQNTLSKISAVYSAVAKITADGKFGPATQNALECFQELFSLSTDGVMGKKTFSALQLVAQGIVSGNRVKVTASYGGTALSNGSSGNSVRLAQSFLNGAAYSGTPITVDGKFGSGTKNATISFQVHKGLDSDGIIGSLTWNELVNAFNNSL